MPTKNLIEVAGNLISLENSILRKHSKTNLSEGIDWTLDLNSSLAAVSQSSFELTPTYALVWHSGLTSQGNHFTEVCLGEYATTASRRAIVYNASLNAAVAFFALSPTRFIEYTSTSPDSYGNTGFAFKLRSTADLSLVGSFNLTQGYLSLTKIGVYRETLVVFKALRQTETFAYVDYICLDLQGNVTWKLDGSHYSGVSEFLDEENSWFLLFGQQSDLVTKLQIFKRYDATTGILQDFDSSPTYDFTGQTCYHDGIFYNFSIYSDLGQLGISLNKYNTRTKAALPRVYHRGDLVGAASLNPVSASGGYGYDYNLRSAYIVNAWIDSLGSFHSLISSPLSNTLILASRRFNSDTLSLNTVALYTPFITNAPITSAIPSITTGGVWIKGQKLALLAPTNNPASNSNFATRSSSEIIPLGLPSAPATFTHEFSQQRVYQVLSPGADGIQISITDLHSPYAIYIHSPSGYYNNYHDAVNDGESFSATVPGGEALIRYTSPSNEDIVLTYAHSDFSFRLASATAQSPNAWLSRFPSTKPVFGFNFSHLTPGSSAATLQDLIGNLTFTSEGAAGTLVIGLNGRTGLSLANGASYVSSAPSLTGITDLTLFAVLRSQSLLNNLPQIILDQTTNPGTDSDESSDLSFLFDSNRRYKSVSTDNVVNRAQVSQGNYNSQYVQAVVAYNYSGNAVRQRINRTDTGDVYANSGTLSTTLANTPFHLGSRNGTRYFGDYLLYELYLVSGVLDDAATLAAWDQYVQERYGF